MLEVIKQRALTKIRPEFSLSQQFFWLKIDVRQSCWQGTFFQKFAGLLKEKTH